MTLHYLLSLYLEVLKHVVQVGPYYFRIIKLIRGSLVIQYGGMAATHVMPTKLSTSKFVTSSINAGLVSHFTTNNVFAKNCSLCQPK